MMDLAASAWRMACDSRTRYRVELHRGLLETDNPLLPSLIEDRQTLVVTTPTVDRVHGQRLRALLQGRSNVAFLVLELDEEGKTPRAVEAVCREALAHGMTRRGLLIAFGGGVCTDVVTMAASMVRRGIGHLRIPTTLIGQIDAGIGLKGSINFSGKKSFLGCFHPPERALIDPTLLATLPPRFVIAGMAESIKMALARDAELFELLEQAGPELVETRFARPAPVGRQVIQRSIAGMLEELEQNPYEDQTYERVVDFGHTFSPALEAALGFELHHGEAVAIDLAFSTHLAFAMGMLTEVGHQRVIRLLRRVGLPTHSTTLDLALCRHALFEASKQRGGAVNLVIPTAIGRTTFLRRSGDLPEEMIERALHLADRTHREQP